RAASSRFTLCADEGEVETDIAARCPYQTVTSLDSHALGEIARFIYVTTELDGEMVRQKLKRDDGQDRHHVIGRFGQSDDLICDAFQMFCAVAACQRNDRSLARLHLFNVVQIF